MKTQQNSLKATNALTRAEMKNILGGLLDGSAEPKDCKDVVCRAEDWCCDAKGICISRNTTTC